MAQIEGSSTTGSANHRMRLAWLTAAFAAVAFTPH
jgi:hypothetical protein